MPTRVEVKGHPARVVSIAFFSLAILASCTSGPDKKPETPSICGSVVTVAEAKDVVTGDRGRVVYQDGEALWLYDVVSDSVTRLKDGLTAGGFAQPRFLDGRSITFVDRRESDELDAFGPHSLYVMDLQTGGVSEVLPVGRQDSELRMELRPDAARL